MNKTTTSRISETDFAALDAMEDEDIDYTDIQEVSSEMFACGVVRRGLKPTTDETATGPLESHAVQPPPKDPAVNGQGAGSMDK